MLKIIKIKQLGRAISRFEKKYVILGEFPLTILNPLKTYLHVAYILFKQIIKFRNRPSNLPIWKNTNFLNWSFAVRKWIKLDTCQ